MTEFHAEEVLDRLTTFQRNTVNHVIGRFYGDDPTDRFLVADQTGLGKTMVARGVIARTIETLQHRSDIDRIDIVYICSNQDLARQNVRKLNVTKEKPVDVASRLTMLAKDSTRFPPIATGGPKAVNLVSFTPGTSFSRGWATGTAEERAMLYLVLEQCGLFPKATFRRSKAPYRFLRATLGSAERFSEHVDWLRTEMHDEVDPRVVAAYAAALDRVRDDGTTLREETEEMIALHSRREVVDNSRSTIGRLRANLARESIQLLSPDLIILDEFQRFRDLLDESSEAGELAHYLFRYRDEGCESHAKVLLLSATPFKPFTYAEESQADDDHFNDFQEVVRFLADGGPDADDIDTALAAYRRDLVAGHLPTQSRNTAREALLRVMVRNERPDIGADVESRTWPVDVPSPEDLCGYVALRELTDAVGGQLSMEYWKSAPYFVNFMDAYKVGAKVRESLKEPQDAPTTRAALGRTQRLSRADIDSLQPFPLGNARMAALAARTVEAGWWKLLWVPPSLPYIEPAGPYAEAMAASMSKLLIFSSWSATPTAIASLLSYEADRLMAGPRKGMSAKEQADDERNRRRRLQYAVRDGRPAAMNALALFFPMPSLADLADPRDFARRAGRPLTAAQLQSEVTAQLREHNAESGAAGGRASVWFEALRRPGAIPDELLSDEDTIREITTALSGAESDEAEDDSPDTAEAPDDGTPNRGSRLTAHVRLALEARGAQQDRTVDDDVLAAVAGIAAHSPANIAYRTLRRLRGTSTAISDRDLWLQAARLASGIRSLFSRPEATLVLDATTPAGEPYWLSMLRYCRDGNLQAAMDEYLHHMAASEGFDPMTPHGMSQLVTRAIETISLRSAMYRWFDPDEPDANPTFPARFALRYGDRDNSSESVRTPQVRQAFNSPFWPFVLASTSVGQEGIDFHWWCHSLLHWNTPPNPVDFEQREGRINRYNGLVVRRNIAAEHEAAILTSPHDDPWEVAYEVAAQAHNDLGDFNPHWVYPGPAKIERNTAPFTLSVDERRLAAVRRDVARYRMTFGQPRQEDLLEVLSEQFPDLDAATVESLRVDLRAPSTSD